MNIPGRAGVYEIINTENGKRYIGSSLNLRRRFNNHFNALKQHKHRNVILQSAWNKYGQENLLFNILIFCDKNKRIYYEQAFLDAFHPEYNIAKDAKAPWKGKTLSEETRRKISLAGMGRKPTEETRRKLSEAQMGNKKGLGKAPWNKGKKATPEIIEAIIAGQTGKKRSEEARRNISNALKGKPKSEEHKKHLSEARIGKPNLSAVGNKNWLGKTHTEETKRKISEAHKGKIFTDEHKRNISKGKKEYYARKRQNKNDKLDGG